MKSMGELVREYREAMGWNTSEMAKQVGTSRQNIENLELGLTKSPRYLPKLAKTMNTTVEDLVNGRFVVNPGNRPIHSNMPTVEEAAASLEARLKGLLDEVIVELRSDQASQPAGAWPFELFTANDFLLLPETERVNIENSIAGAILRVKANEDSIRNNTIPRIARG